MKDTLNTMNKPKIVCSENYKFPIDTPDVSFFGLCSVQYILISLGLSSIDRRLCVCVCGFLIIHFSAALRPFVIIHSHNNNKTANNNDEEKNEQVHTTICKISYSAQTITLGIGFIVLV